LRRLGRTLWHDICLGPPRKGEDRMSSSLRSSLVSAALLALVAASPAGAQTVQGDFADAYTIRNLGSPENVPGSLGGLTFLDFNTLLIGGAANTQNAKIYRVGVVRDADNHVIAFDGPATEYATAQGVSGGIDGGLQFHPDSGVLFYTSYSDNRLGQIKPGSSGPDKLIDLSSFGVTGSVGALAFVPTGFEGEGDLIVASYSTSNWYRLGLAEAADGTYD